MWWRWGDTLATAGCGDDREAIEAAMRHLGIDDIAGRQIGELSGGAAEVIVAPPEISAPHEA